MNMSYCRFENTANDLKDCYDAMNDGTEELSEYEDKALKRLIRLCRKIVENFGECEE